MGQQSEDRRQSCLIFQTLWHLALLWNMEKNVYETYEFLPSSNHDTDSNQFFVLQDDGTILTVNKEIQYITQGEDNKDAGQLNPAVYDVSTQQYYVEYEGNASEMISLSDQFAISNGDDNVYANSFLIQPDTTSTPQQMETDTVIDPQKLDAQQMQQLNIEVLNGVKQTTDLTEITLTDEQYQTLEQKGWLLLESHDRVFVLNTLGLHDITSNERLIQRLKNEFLESTDTSSEMGHLKIESISCVLADESACADANIDEQGSEESAVEYFITNNTPLQQLETEDQPNVRYVAGPNVDEEMAINEPDIPGVAASDAVTRVAKEPVVLNSLLKNSAVNTSAAVELPKKFNSIGMKIKTKYIFNDIPDKIYLGKTVNGKKLFAKVKRKQKCRDLRINNTKSDNKPNYNTILDAAMFTNLIQDSYKHTPNVTAKCVQFADAVVNQLLRLPNLTDSIVENNLVITKIIISHTETGKEVEQPTMVTGFMKVQDDNYVFCHAPNLLRELNTGDDWKNDTDPNASKTDTSEKIAGGLIELFHIHISEIRCTDKPPETSIHLSKRKIPVDVLNDLKKKHPNPTYGCGTCGAVFRSEQQLKDHQDDECIDVEDKLTIDYTDEAITESPSYYVTVEGKEKIYSCTLCEEKFKRLYNCNKHIKAHKVGIEKKLKVYKCKMCSNTYFHSSSLSKHIVKTHIQTKINNV